MKSMAQQCIYKAIYSDNKSKDYEQGKHVMENHQTAFRNYLETLPDDRFNSG